MLAKLIVIIVRKTVFSDFIYLNILKNIAILISKINGPKINNFVTKFIFNTKTNTKNEKINKGKKGWNP